MVDEGWVGFCGLVASGYYVDWKGTCSIIKKYDCAFIDLNSIAIPSYIDGLHFEPSEHEKIAKIIFEHL